MPGCRLEQKMPPVIRKSRITAPSPASLRELRNVAHPASLREKDALLRTAQAADIAGIRCLLVHAKDDAARQWCESWEFEPSPTDPYHLFLMLKDINGMLSK